MLYIKKFNSDTDKENYIKNNFVSPHLFLNSQNKSLNYFPKYKRLEYISSTKTGGQYIDLGCKLFENTDDIHIDTLFNIKGNGENVSNHATIINAMEEVSPYPGFTIRRDENTNNIMVIAGNNFSEKNFDYPAAYAHIYFDKFNSLLNCNITIDNIPNNQLHHITTLLFCSLDSSGNTWRFAEADLYYCKITKGNTVIRNLIPVQRQKDNAVGLWDLENQIFYTSQGNQPFIAGINYDHKIQYLESTKKQSINSGITPSMDLDFEIKFSCNDLPNSIQNADSGTIFGARQSHLINLYQLSTYTMDSISNIGHFAYGSQDLFYHGYACPKLNLQTNVIHTIRKDGLNFTCADGTNFTLTDDNFTDTRTIRIFSLFDDNIIEKSSIKLYSLKFWKHSTGEMLRDFIPVRKNGVGYLYDKVSKTLFGDEINEENFILGPDI